MYTERRTRVRLTWLGYAFLAIVMLAFAAAFNDNNSLAFMLVFLMLGLSLVAFVKGALNVAHLNLQRFGVDDTFADHRIPVRGVLDRRYGLPVRFLRLSAAGDTVRGHAELPNLDPGEVFSLTLPPRPRGLVELTEFTVSSVYPSGLFEWSVHFDQFLADALIYPAPVDYLSNPDLQTAAERDSAGGDFDDLEPWQPGQPLTRICWKTLARTGRRMRKHFAVAEPQGDVVLDWEQLTSLTDEQKRSQLCHGVVLGHRQQRNYGLRLPGRHIDASSGARHYRRCLTALARS